MICPGCEAPVLAGPVHAGGWHRRCAEEVLGLPAEWRAVPGLPGYEVSRSERVRSWWGHSGGGRRRRDVTPHELLPRLSLGRYRVVDLMAPAGRRVKRSVAALVRLAFGD